MDTIQPFAAVVLVLVLLAGTLLLLRKRGAAGFRLPGFATGNVQGRDPRRLEVLERLALDPQHSLHLVRVGGRSVVIATTPSSCQLLCEESPE